MGKSSPRGRTNTPRWQDYQGLGGKRSAPAGTGFRGSGREARPEKTFRGVPRVVLWGGLAGALIAAFVIIISNRPRPMPVVVLSISGYGDFAPPNAYAAEDADLLERLLAPRGIWARDFRVQRVATPAEGRGRQTPDEIRNALTAAVEESLKRTGAGDGKTIVIYLSAHGAVDEEGSAVLLAADLDPSQNPGRPKGLKVEDVLNAIQQAVPEKMYKVVFIDAGHTPFYWHSGLGRNRVENGFATALQKVVSRVKAPNLYVINSTSAGEISWAAPELGGSVFGHFVARGLAGAADDNRDKKLNLDELVGYVQRSVSTWTRTHRLAAQTPIVVRFDDAQGDQRRVPSIKVADASSSGTALQVAADGQNPAEPLEDFLHSRKELLMKDLKSSARQLEELWERHALLAGRGPASAEVDLPSLPPFSRLPEKWARFELMLVRAEQYRFAGKAYQEELRKAISEAQRLLSELERPAEEVPPLSLPLAQEGSAEDSAAMAEKLQELAKRDQISKQDLAKSAEELHGLNGGDERPPPVESLFVRMLAAHLPGGTDAVANLVPQAIKLRALAEQIAAPRDVRALPWARLELTAERENLRRLCEDRLFVGTPESTGQLKDQYDRLMADYERTAETVERVVQAYRTRDEILALLPHLAEWHLSNLQISAIHGEQASSADAGAEHLKQLQEINKLRGRVETLGDRLASRSDEFEDILPDVQLLRTQMDRIPDDIMRRAGHEKRFQQIWLALQNPLFTGDNRRQMREQFVADLERYDPAGRPAPAAAGSNPDPARAAGGAQSLVRTEADYSEVLGSFAGRNGAASSPATDARDALLERGDHSRRASAVFNAYGRATDRTTRELFTLNRYRQYVWHAERAVDDFWGPVPDLSSATVAGAGGNSYFQQAGQTFLDKADELARNPQASIVTADSSPLVRAIRDILSARQGAAQQEQGIKLYAASSLQPRGTNPLKVEVAPGLPAGRAAVALPPAEDFVLKLGNHDYARYGLNVSQPEDVALEYGGDEQTKEEKCTTVTVLYRGHQWNSPNLCVEGIGPHNDVVWIPPRPRQSTITVQGLAQQKPEVLFILDCSLSMNETITGGRGENVNVSLLSMAGMALKTVVDSMLDDSYRVELMVYAHAFGVQGRNAIDRQGSVVASELAVTDVKTVFPWKEINRITKDDFKNKVDEVVRQGPYGITPLYYSIVQGIQRFSNTDGPKQIVVVTDGADTQAGYITQLRANVTPTRPGDVQTALRAKGGDLRVDILGIGNMRQDEHDSLKALADRLGGRYFPIKSAQAADPIDDLANSIQSLLKPAEYTVSPLVAGQAAPGRQPVRLPLSSVWVEENDDRIAAGRQRSVLPLEAQYEIQVHDGEDPRRHVNLSGGEGLLLWYDRSGPSARRLAHRRYDAKHTSTPLLWEKRVENLRNPYRSELLPEDCFVAPHQAERVDGTAVFRVSVQNQNEYQFSHRPRHVWAEIRPVLREPRETWPVFPCFDLAFEENTPAPVLMFRVPQWRWPQTDAEVRLWVSYEPEPNLKVEARPVQIGPDAPVRQQLTPPAAADLRNVEFEVEIVKRDGANKFQVIVVERYKDPQADIYSARVQMTPQPDQATHKYYTRSKLVRHEFTFDDAQQLLGTDQAQVLITPRTEIVKNAVAVTDREENNRRISPFQVRVP